jgi:hypothetical protein
VHYFMPTKTKYIFFNLFLPFLVFALWILFVWGWGGVLNERFLA